MHENQLTFSLAVAHDRAQRWAFSIASGIAMRAGMIIVPALQEALLLGGADQTDWPWAWGYFGISLRFWRSPDGLAAILLI